MLKNLLITCLVILCIQTNYAQDNPLNLEIKDGICLFNGLKVGNTWKEVEAALGEKYVLDLNNWDYAG